MNQVVCDYFVFHLLKVASVVFIIHCMITVFSRLPNEWVTTLEYSRARYGKVLVLNPYFTIQQYKASNEKVDRVDV